MKNGYHVAYIVPHETNVTEYQIENGASKLLQMTK